MGLPSMGKAAFIIRTVTTELMGRAPSYLLLSDFFFASSTLLRRHMGVIVDTFLFHARSTPTAAGHLSLSSGLRTLQLLFMKIRTSSTFHYQDSVPRKVKSLLLSFFLWGLD
jgi:hypothetical protein